MKPPTMHELDRVKSAVPKAVIWANNLEQHRILKKQGSMEHSGLQYVYVPSLGALVRVAAIEAIKQQRKEQSCRTK